MKYVIIQEHLSDDGRDIVRTVYGPYKKTKKAKKALKKLSPVFSHAVIVPLEKL